MIQLSECARFLDQESDALRRAQPEEPVNRRTVDPGSRLLFLRQLGHTNSLT
jgi:hypothetical protein